MWHQVTVLVSFSTVITRSGFQVLVLTRFPSSDLVYRTKYAYFHHKYWLIGYIKAFIHKSFLNFQSFHTDERTIRANPLNKLYGKKKIQSVKSAWSILHSVLKVRVRVLSPLEANNKDVIWTHAFRTLFFMVFAFLNWNDSLIFFFDIGAELILFLVDPVKMSIAFDLMFSFLWAFSFFRLHCLLPLYLLLLLLLAKSGFHFILP